VVAIGLRSGQWVAALCTLALERTILGIFVPLVVPTAVDQKAHDELLGTKRFVVGAQFRR